MGVIVEHIACGQHMATMGIIDDAICLSCLGNEETAERFLCNCPPFSGIRRRLLGYNVLSTDKSHTLSLPDLLRYSHINESKRFTEMWLQFFCVTNFSAQLSIEYMSCLSILSTVIHPSVAQWSS